LVAHAVGVHVEQAVAVAVEARAREGAAAVFDIRRSVVIASSFVRATKDLVTVADVVFVLIRPVPTANPAGIEIHAAVSSVSEVVTGKKVGAVILRIAHAIVVRVAVGGYAVLAELTADGEDARTCIRSSCVVVAGVLRLAADNLVAVAHAIVVRVAVGGYAVLAELTPRGNDARSIFVRSN
jgi:hypothetical protein